MMGFIKILQKRPTDKTIRIIRILFGLILILGGYYNLIYQGDLLETTIFGQEISEQTAQYIKIAILSLGVFPLYTGLTGACILKKKYMRFLQIFFAIVLFYTSGLIQESADLEFDTLLGFMGIVPLFAGITGKMITSTCMRHAEKITKIRV